MRWVDSITDSMNMNLTLVDGRQRSLACYSPWGFKEKDTNLATE